MSKEKNLKVQITQAAKTITIIKRIAKVYGVDIKFYKLTEHSPGGFFDSRTHLLNIGKSDCPRELLSTFFHELGHKYCHDMGIFPAYHRWTFKRNRPVFSKEQLRALIRTGLRAERWVDNWAKQEMKMWMPEIPYSPGYNTKQDVKWYNRYFLNRYRFKLKYHR